MDGWMNHSSEFILGMEVVLKLKVGVTASSALGSFESL